MKRTEDCPLQVCGDLNPTLGFAYHLLCAKGPPSVKPIALLLGCQSEKEAFNKGRTISIIPHKRYTKHKRRQHHAKHQTIHREAQQP